MIRNAPKDAAVYGVDLGKNPFHVVGLDPSGAVVLQFPIAKPVFELHCD